MPVIELHGFANLNEAFGLYILDRDFYPEEILEKKKQKAEENLSLVSGKMFIRKLNDWLRKEYKVSCSIDKIIKEMKADEIENEMAEVLQLFS